MLQSMLHANTLNCKASIRAHIYAHTRARPLAPCRAASEPTPPPAEAPSRGVLILPGLGNNAGDYGQLADALRSRGLAVEVAQVGRPDWSRNAAALTDINWWKGSLKPRPAVDWYLARVDAAMDTLKRRLGEQPITLLSHSAGGWLGRVYMLDFGTAGIDRFVTLGSPHNPPPAGAAGVVDQTRGILTFCQDACPGAFHDEVKYVTIAGRYIKGVKLTGEGGWKAKFAGAGYQQVCGDAEVWGDFIVPVAAAHLDGAINIDIEDCFHSPLGADLSFFGPWYGSPQMVDQWVHYVTDDWASLQPGTYDAEGHQTAPGPRAAAAAAAAAAASGGTNAAERQAVAAEGSQRTS